MKVIDVLNKIANGEEVPKKIKYDNHIFEYKKGFNRDIEYICIDAIDDLYKQVDINNSIGEIYKIPLILNDVVEIIEDTPQEDLINHLVKDCGCVIEDTPKEDISNLKWGEYVIKEDVKKCSQKDLRTYISLLMETQNKIIDYLKSKGDE